MERFKELLKVLLDRIASSTCSLINPDIHSCLVSIVESLSLRSQKDELCLYQQHVWTLRDLMLGFRTNAMEISEMDGQETKEIIKYLKPFRDLSKHIARKIDLCQMRNNPSCIKCTSGGCYCNMLIKDCCKDEEKRLNKTRQVYESTECLSKEKSPSGYHTANEYFNMTSSTGNQIMTRVNQGNFEESSNFLRGNDIKLIMCTNTGISGHSFLSQQTCISSEKSRENVAILPLSTDQWLRISVFPNKDIVRQEPCYTSTFSEQNNPGMIVEESEAEVMVKNYRGTRTDARNPLVLQELETSKESQGIDSEQEPQGRPTTSGRSRSKKSTQIKLATTSQMTKRKLACDIEGCAYRARSNSELVQHKRKHTGDRPIGCEWNGCPKRFKDTSTYRLHYRSIHLKRKDYVCTVPGCGRRFGCAKSRNRHAANLRLHDRLRADGHM